MCEEREDTGGKTRERWISNPNLILKPFHATTAAPS